jgi:asparagine synthase (glutamine-hydrolysing)
VLKKIARDRVPTSILKRSKQPYRAPDALSFASPEATEWIEEVASERALADAGVFAPAAARQLIAKCRARANAGQFSNTDNMGVVGVLSTQLVHHHFIREQPRAASPTTVRTVVDRAPTAVTPPS